ncbi:MAG: hypothetical protein AABY15_09395, partial [Nanoarchaeota archaeon]
MRLKSLGLFAFGVLALVFLMSAVSAVTIFTDNFNVVGLTGWTATGWTNTAGTYADSTNTASTIINRTISTSGYQTIIVKYDRQLATDWETTDSFKISWSTNGTTFVTLEEVVGSAADTLPSDSAFVSKTFNLPTSADSNTNFQIKFECNTNAADEFCRVDNVVIEATALPVIPSEITACNAVGNPGNLDVRK